MMDGLKTYTRVEYLLNRWNKAISSLQSVADVSNVYKILYVCSIVYKSISNTCCIQMYTMPKCLSPCIPLSLQCCLQNGIGIGLWMWNFTYIVYWNWTFCKQQQTTSSQTIPREYSTVSRLSISMLNNFVSKCTLIKPKFTSSWFAEYSIKTKSIHSSWKM